MDMTLTFRSSVGILIMLRSYVKIVDVAKGSCRHLEFTKREERMERRDKERWSPRTMNDLIVQREQSWFRKIVKGLMIRRWPRVSFGETIWNVSWKPLLISADYKSIRWRSEGNKKAVFFYKRDSGVDVLGWICHKLFRIGEMSIVKKWVSFGGSLQASVLRRLFTRCSLLPNEALFWWEARMEERSERNVEWE